MSGPLNGRKVLVTRPQEQAEQLCRLIESDGGIAIAFPTLDLSPSIRLQRQDLLAVLAAAGHVIFVSRNAVRFTAALAGDLGVLLRGKTVIAVGDGTRRELAGHQIDEVISPGAQSGSEELLDLPALQEEQVRGREVLIVRGDGGRELLLQQLRARGADVNHVDVYQRSEPAGARQRTGQIWRRDRPDVIVVTSEQGLQNLIRMTAEQDRAIMFDRKLVVMSPRLAEVADAAGFSIPARVAPEQSDTGLLQAIRQTVE